MRVKTVFNLNEYVHVKLTDLGLEILRDEYRDTFSPLSQPTADKVDVHVARYVSAQYPGHHRFQTWEFMRIFGKHVYLGMNPQPFEMDVHIEVTVPL